jgi:hypothetical protein
MSTASEGSTPFFSTHLWRKLTFQLTTGAGRVETLVLPYGYRHLSPLVDQPRSSP